VRVAVSVAHGALAAYAFSRLDFRLKGPSYFLLITTMIVPVQIILIPLLPWFQILNLTGDMSQYVGIILVHVAFGAGWAVFMLGGLFVWNDLLLALTLLDRDHQPITVGLANLQAPHLAQENLVSAGAIMAILPPLLLFALLNRYYVRGLFAGGVKG
jgi:alpha-glucoside transport system permease protein